MLQRSFSLIADDSDVDSADEKPMVTTSSFDKGKGNSAGSMTKIHQSSTNLNGSDSEENSISPKRTVPDKSKFLPQDRNETVAPLSSNLGAKINSELSGRHTVLKSRINDAKENANIYSSESDPDDSDSDVKKEPVHIPGEYDYKAYENLEVDDDAKEIFQYITKYTPQHLNLDYKFRPFIPEFLPAVGDIDAFLKVVPPESTLSGEVFETNQLQLGLVVLDEPAANQSDPALLHLQLRAASNTVTHSNPDVVVKKVNNVEKNVKTIDKWIKDISDLHKSKSSPVVKYPETMPDLDDLMQEWPEEVENHLREHGFPYPDSDTALSEYIDTVCGIFEIPVLSNKMYSLHLLFCLYAAIKNSQLYNVNNKPAEKDKPQEQDTDQLVLE